MNQTEFERARDELLESSALDIEFLHAWYEQTLKQLASLSKQRKAIAHPRYRGDSREGDFVSLLESILPPSVGTENGFVVNEYGTQSREQDCILLDRQRAAIFATSENAKFFPIEAVLGAVEIKSKLTLSELRKTIINCISMKKLAYHWGLSDEGYKDPARVRTAYFVFGYDIAGKCSNICQHLNELLRDVPAPLRPNMFYLLGHGFLLPSSDGSFPIGHDQLFVEEKFHYQGAMGTKTIPKSNAPTFLWFLTNIIDHCIAEVGKREDPWYGKYVISPMFFQQYIETKRDEGASN